MDREFIKNGEEAIKVFDSDYEPKTVQPGSVIDIFVEIPGSKQPLRSQVMYIKKEDEMEGPAGIGNISYPIALKYFIGCYKDESIQVGNATITINEIYDNVKEYVDRDEKDVEVGIGSIVEVDHNGHEKKYYIIEPTDEINVQRGIDVIFTTSPLAINLLSKKKGDKVVFDVAMINNEVEIKKIYKGINDYNKKKGIHLINTGSVAEVLIDNIPFVFNFTDETLDKPESELYEYVDINSSLGQELANTTEGDTFTYSLGKENLRGYINRVYDSLDEYLENSFIQDITKEGKTK